MDFVKRYPILTAILALCVAAFAVEVFFLISFRGKATAAARSLGSSESRLNTILGASPAPTDANLQAAQQNVAELTSRRDEIIKQLSADTVSAKFPPAPTSGVDLLTSVQGYVDTLTADAKSHNVIVAPGFTFGMGQYVGGVPPPSDKLPVVYRQMCALEYILKHLINDSRGANYTDANQELYLVSVEREDVAYGAVSADESTAKETFTIDPLVSARVSGAVDTLAFRVKFVAYTASLQSLLTYLAKFELPLVVRGVDVASVPAERIASMRSAANAPEIQSSNNIGAGLEPVITDNFSEFTVVIELINIIPPGSADQVAATPDSGGDSGAAAESEPAAASATDTPAAEQPAAEQPATEQPVEAAGAAETPAQ